MPSAQPSQNLHEDPHTILADMFKSLVSALDLPARHQLSEIVQYGHTRITPNHRHLPVMFFRGRDDIRYNTAKPYLSSLSSHQPSAQSQSTHETSTPISGNPQLHEQVLYSKLDPVAKREYLAERRGECQDVLDVAAKHWHSLDPDPKFEHQQHVHTGHDREEAQWDADDQWTDDEMEDDYYSDDAASWSSEMSDVTYEPAHTGARRVYNAYDSPLLNKK